MKPKFEYKPKATLTLRRMVRDMVQHCQHVSQNPVFGCNTCAYNVFYAPQQKPGCYFEHTGGLKPKDWQLNEMGSCVYR